MSNPEDSAEPSLIPGAAGTRADTDLSLGSQVLDSQTLGVKTASSHAPNGHPNPKASLWDSKPWWCQPWTIVLSGLIAIASSWGLLHKVWITVMMSIAIAAWWLLFLVLVPRAYQEGQP